MSGQHFAALALFKLLKSLKKKLNIRGSVVLVGSLYLKPRQRATWPKSKSIFALPFSKHFDKVNICSSVLMFNSQQITQEYFIRVLRFLIL